MCLTYSEVPENVSRVWFHIILLIVPCALLRAQWFESYEKGREAVRKGQWQQAVTLLSEALDAEPDSRANKQTYGLQFIDYFPYLYRGIAYYKLGDLASAKADLGKAKSEGAVEDAQRDREAPTLLATYLGLIEKPAPPIAQQKPEQQKSEQKKPEQKPEGKLPEKPAPTPPQVDPKYTEGVRLFNQKSYREALDQFKGVAEASPEHAHALRYIERAQAELKKIDAAEKKERIERAYASALEEFRRDDLDRAEEGFRNVLALDPAHSGAAEYIRRIQARKVKLAAAQRPREAGPATGRGATEAADTVGQALFGDAVRLLNAGRLRQAKSEFLSLQRIAPSYPELAGYMQSIGSIENTIHRGIAAFFQGEYTSAIEQLRSSSKNGNDNPHVYAFLACSYAAEYLLDGARDGKLKKQALEAFRAVKGLNPGYELDAKLVSPRIIALLTAE
jgi:tetratricopeptide (TPR) repeat protein